MARKKAAPKPTTSVKRPKYGAWVEGEPGWTVCPVHDTGIQPGSTCLECRIERLEVTQ